VQHFGLDNGKLNTLTAYHVLGRRIDIRIRN
jgi:hypothetical protein